MARGKVVTWSRETMRRGEVVLHTARLLLRPLRESDATVLRELWTEPDPRVPPHRRIDADGNHGR